MADVIMKRRQIKQIIEDGHVESHFFNQEDCTFLPAALAIDVIEKEKKGGVKMPSKLKSVIDEVSEYAPVIPLSPHGLYEAMNDPDFSKKYTNRSGNPIEMATEASAYEYEGWWDRTEYLNSFVELIWT